MSPTLFLANGLLECSLILDSFYRWFVFLQTGKPSLKSFLFNVSTPFAATTTDFLNCALFSIGVSSLFVYFNPSSASKREVALPVAVGSLLYHTQATALIYLNHFVYPEQLGPFGARDGLVYGHFDQYFTDAQHRVDLAGVGGCAVHGIFALWFLVYIIFGSSASSSSSSKKKVKTF
jgi:hypothetical protein